VTVPPIITIVGRSNSGKTTLVEKLVRELTCRGYRIATIKDSHKQPTFDAEGKDSARHAAAGSITTAIRTQTQIVIIHNKSNTEASLDELVRLLGEDADFIIAEGFKYANAPKIEVHRAGMTLLENPQGLIAVATDEKLDIKVPQFDINDFSGICDLLEKEFIIPNQHRIALYINNTPVDLKEFPDEIIENVITNMVHSLKGVNHIENIDISIRKSENKS